MTAPKHIIHLVSNKVWGGGEQYVYDLCNTLKADGCDITLLTRDAAPVVARMAGLGVSMHQAALRGAPDAASAFRLAAILRRKKGSCVIHVHNFKDAFTAAYSRILSGKDNVKIVVTRHLVRRGKNCMPYRWLYRHIDTIVFVSDLAKREFLAGCRNVPHGTRLLTVRNSIKVPEEMEKIDIRKEFGIDAQTVVAMYHGRICAEKGLDVLVEAMSMLKNKNVCLVLIGSGDDDYTEHLKRKAAGLLPDERIVFAGFRNNAPAYLGSCDFGILPSVVQESSSLSCMEYMSQGRCVIATDNGGQAEYLSDGHNALLVAPNDAEALAGKIDTLAGNAELRQKLSRKAYTDFKENMNYNKFIKHIKEDVYDC